MLFVDNCYTWLIVLVCLLTNVRNTGNTTYIFVVVVVVLFCFEQTSKKEKRKKLYI